MSNQELAKIFYEIADYLEMEGAAFKPQAHRKAAAMIESLKGDIGAIYQKGGVEVLKEIPGVGEGLAKKIEEYIKTGKIRELARFKKKMPVDLDNIVRVEGMGVKKAKILYEKLGVKNLKDLEKAAKAHKIAPLFGFGEKTEKNILEGIEFLKRDKGRFLLGEILPRAAEIGEKLKRLRDWKNWKLAVPSAGARKPPETLIFWRFRTIRKKLWIFSPIFPASPKFGAGAKQKLR